MSAAVTFRPVSVVSEGLPIYLRGRIEAKLVTVNKRLAKLGAPAATVAFGPVIARDWKDERGFTHTAHEFETVTVTGSEAKLGGWSAVASLDHSLAGGSQPSDEDGAAFITRFPAHHDTDLPAHFRNRGPVCDHCKIAIASRKLTIVFVHDDGTWMQVGTSCVLDFIGVDPSNVLWLASFAEVTDADDEGGEGWYRHCGPTPTYFVACAAEATRVSGFVPASHIDRWPTRDQAWLIADPRGAHDRARIAKEFPELDGERGGATAAQVVEWAMTNGDGSEFMANARVALRASEVTGRTAGLLAALPWCWMKAQEKLVARKAEAETGLASEWVGTVGKMLDGVGTVIVDRTYDGDYGARRLIVVKFDDGAEVSTMGSGDTLFDVEKGMRVKVRGKVKAHETNQYGKRTTLTLAKLAELADDGTPLPSLRRGSAYVHAYGDHEATPDVHCYHCMKAVHAAKVTVAA